MPLWQNDFTVEWLQLDNQVVSYINELIDFFHSGMYGNDALGIDPCNAFFAHKPCLGSYQFLQACTSWFPPFFTLLVQMLFPPKGIFKGVTTEYQNQALSSLYQTTSPELQQQQVLFSFDVYGGAKLILFLSLLNDSSAA